MLWVSTIISYVLKMNFHSSYSVFIVEKSGTPDINMFLVVNFSLDLAAIILYAICMLFANKNGNCIMGVGGVFLLLIFAFRFFFGALFLYRGYQVENENVKFQAELHRNIVYEICLEIIMLPVAIVGLLLLKG